MCMCVHMCVGARVYNECEYLCGSPELTGFASLKISSPTISTSGVLGSQAIATPDWLFTWVLGFKLLLFLHLKS